MASELTKASVTAPTSLATPDTSALSAVEDKKEVVEKKDEPTKVDVVEKVKPFKVQGVPGIPDGEVTPEMETALKHNNPDVYAELMVQKKEFYGVEATLGKPISPEPIIIVDRPPDGHEDVVVTPTVIVISEKDEKNLSEGTEVSNPAPKEKEDKKKAAPAATAKKATK